MAYNHMDIALFNNALEDGPGVANFGLCCAGNSNSAGVKYEMGASTSPSSYPINPALALGINPATGFPCEFGSTAGHCVVNNESYEVYGALPNTRQPVSDLYSLDVQYELPYSIVGTVGYTGSVGRHYARLVDQNFIYSQCFPATANCGGTTAITPVSAAYFAQTDSNQSYNALNVNFTRHTAHGLYLSAYYTWSKSLDQVSNGDAADANANQTNPANNTTEWGPSDYDVHQRIVGTAVYEVPHVHSGGDLVKAVANGWQINGIVTYYTGFPWTPVTYDLQANELITGANLVGPTRPLAYYGGARFKLFEQRLGNRLELPQRRSGLLQHNSADKRKCSAVCAGHRPQQLPRPMLLRHRYELRQGDDVRSLRPSHAAASAGECLQHLQHSSTGADYLQ